MRSSRTTPSPLHVSPPNGEPPSGAGAAALSAGSNTRDREVVGTIGRSLLGERLTELDHEIGSTARAELNQLVEDGERDNESLRDALSTRLMEHFRLCQGRSCFGMLYELNQRHLLVQVQGRLRRFQSKIDAHDVLQEVFFNVYRYPHRFNCAREDAFRVWSATIVRNTVLKSLRSMKRGGRSEIPFEDLTEQPEVRSKGPMVGALEKESSIQCQRVYLTYLQLYLRFYSMLSERERHAIQMVEVEDRSYRDAAADLGIKLENLKMVIFRARRKIYRSMSRVFEGLPPDFRPARDPHSTAHLEGSEGASSRSHSRSESITQRALNPGDSNPVGGCSRSQASSLTGAPNGEVQP
ncbi:MAG: RNA polymerase sigma factor (sigma-70 family) [Planctomycetota bacterium]